MFTRCLLIVRAEAVFRYVIVILVLIHFLIFPSLQESGGKASSQTITFTAFLTYQVALQTQRQCFRAGVGKLDGVDSL